VSDPRVSGAGSRASLVTPVALVDLVERRLVTGGQLAEPSLVRLTQLHRRFARFVTQAAGIKTTEGIAPKHIRAFVESRGRDGRVPSIATKHLRRSAVRLLFREARRIGLTDADPARDLALPPRSSLRTRPLTDDEVSLCRSFSQRSLTDTTWPAAWALSEAGVRCRELPRIQVQDLSLSTGTLRVWAGSRIPARTTTLTDWGEPVLDRHLGRAAVPDSPIIPLSFSTLASAFAQAHRLVAGTLRRAGLGREPDVTPT
jgi:site-specific recombinase XerD